mgnify:CR=1 FL=1
MSSLENDHTAAATTSSGTVPPERRRAGLLIFDEFVVGTAAPVSPSAWVDCPPAEPFTAPPETEQVRSEPELALSLDRLRHMETETPSRRRFVVKLIDLHSDGRQILVGRGEVRLRRPLLPVPRGYTRHWFLAGGDPGRVGVLKICDVRDDGAERVRAEIAVRFDRKHPCPTA